jgi:hypothetical protein
MNRTSSLKPGGPLKRRTPMRQVGFSSANKKTLVAGAGLLRVAAVRYNKAKEAKPPKLDKPRKWMKSKGPKMTPIRASAKGQECTLRFPGICNRNPDTTVWCHSNRLVDGKGMGLKAPDEVGCYGCYACHAWLDGGYAASGTSREFVDARFDAAREESREILREKGLLPAFEANDRDDHAKPKEAV